MLAWVYQFSGLEEVKPSCVEFKSFVLIHFRFRFADPQSFLYSPVCLSLMHNLKFVVCPVNFMVVLDCMLCNSGKLRVATSCMTVVLIDANSQCAASFSNIASWAICACDLVDHSCQRSHAKIAQLDMLGKLAAH